MAEEKLLTVRDVSMLLGISEKDVLNLAECGKLPAYKIGGVYLRFKKEQVQQFKKTSPKVQVAKDESRVYPLKDRIVDFFYFNDFYIVTILIAAFLLFIILK